MPFVSAAQEFALKKNAPEVWKKWVKKYGHHPAYVHIMAARSRKDKDKKD
jgi:hypothetical protein